MSFPVLRQFVVSVLCLVGGLSVAPLQAAPSGGGTTDDFTREFAALEEAAALLEEVKDEGGAKAAAAKLRATFSKLPAPVKGSEAELMQWARLQNRVSTEMWRLKKEPFWETQGLQEIWTLISDPFSRPGSIK